jgi:hypothetical protein
MLWPWMSRRKHEAAVAELTDDALLALRMAFADANPRGHDWTKRANALWAEVHE